jgi:hypothetical protein
MTKKNLPPRYYFNDNTNSLVRKKPTIRYILCILLVFILGLLLSDKLYHAHAKAISAHTGIKPTNVLITENNLQLSKLNSSINSIIQSNPNITFGISIENLNDNTQLNYGEIGPMTSASVSKVLTATDFLKRVELGEESINEILDDGNTASADINSMITVSDDSAWGALNDEISYSQLQDYGGQLGLSSYDAQTNSLSPSDTAKLFSKLYEGKLLNAAHTKLVLSYMLKANYRLFIIPAVPGSDTVYHKVGELDDDVNDAAIITNGKQTIVLSIYTDGNGTYDWPSRAILMQQITTAALDYYKLN